MKCGLLFLVLAVSLCFTSVCYSDSIDFERLADAIYIAEGGQGYYYGIKSVKYKDEAEARQICINSIRNGLKRWERAGRPGTFLEHFGNRYCPPNAHKLNQYWLSNVRSIYNQ